MNPRVLVIDDSEIERLILQKVFTLVEPNVELIMASSGEEGLNYLRSQPKSSPILVLLDVNMPKKNGHEVLMELKQDEKLKTIPVCMFSNSDLEKDVHSAYSYCASMYIKKPASVENLKKFVSNSITMWFEFASMA